LCLLLLGCGTPDEKANALFVRAADLVDEARFAGQTDYGKAAQSYEQAVSLLERILDRYPSSQVAVELAQGKSGIGGLSLEQMKTIALPRVQSFAEAETDLIAAALLLAREGDEPYLRASAVHACIAALVETGRVDEAKAVASEQKGLGFGDSALRALHSALAAMGETRSGVSWADSIGDDAFAAEVYLTAANHARLEEQDARSASLIDSAESRFRRLGDYRDTVRGLVRVGAHRDSLGLETESLSVLASALELIAASVDDLLGGYLVEDVAEAIAASGGPDKARAVVSAISVPSQRVVALWAVAEYCIDDGQEDAARSILSELKRTVAGHSSEYETKRSRLRLVTAYALLGDEAAALGCFTPSKSSFVRDFDLEELVDALCDGGMPDRALEFAEEISDYEWRKMALAAVARAFVDAGRLDDAESIQRHLFDDGVESDLRMARFGALVEGGQTAQALRAARAMDEEWERSAAIATVVSAQCKSEGLSDALTTLAELEDSSARAVVLIAIASGLGHPETANESGIRTGLHHVLSPSFSWLPSGSSAVGGPSESAPSN